MAAICIFPCAKSQWSPFQLSHIRELGGLAMETGPIIPSLSLALSPKRRSVSSFSHSQIWGSPSEAGPIWPPLYHLSWSLSVKEGQIRLFLHQRAKKANRAVSQPTLPLCCLFMSCYTPVTLNHMYTAIFDHFLYHII